MKQFDKNNKRLCSQFENIQWIEESGVSPEQLEEMLRLSKILSQDIPFVRTDFYVIEGKVYFGEITFFPASGFAEFDPPVWDAKFGSWLTLPEQKA